MGVPKQVMDMEKDGDMEIAATVAAEQKDVQNDNSVAESNGEVQTVEKPSDNVPLKKANILAAVSESTKPDADATKLAMMEKSAIGRLHDLQGQLRAQRETHEKQVEELNGKIAELEGKLKNAETSKRTIEDDASDEEIFSDIRKEYSEEDYSDDDLKRFIRIINRVGNRGVRSIQKRIDEFDEERKETARRKAKADADSFVKRLVSEFPGFKEMDENNDPRWIGFLSTSLGGVMEGTTYGDIAKDALKSLDYRKFSAVVSEFARQSGIVFNPKGKPIDGTVSWQIRPNSVRSERQDSTKSQTKDAIVPMAEIEEFRRAAFARKAEERYGMTSKQVAERLRFYEDAEADGRVS